MKRKLAAIVMFALSVTLLGGCGNGSGSKKGEAISEYLSKEKVIAYEVDAVDKAETPEHIYFFEDGKVTIIPGEEFGMTLGDFAQMKDKEIWENYETVRENYIEKYKEEKISSYKSRFESDIESIQTYKEELQCILTELSTRAYDYSNAYDVDALYYNMVSVLDYSSNTLYCSEEYFQELEMNIYQYTENPDMLEEGRKYIIGETETIISNMDSALAKLQAEADSINADQCAVPFCDISFQFVVETDSSGNNAQSQAMLYPTLKYNPGEEIPGKTYETLGFALGLEHTQDIYDTTYNCIALTGSGQFCTRDSLILDTLDSKNILIDLSDNEKNELFKEEVAARYE